MSLIFSKKFSRLSLLSQRGLSYLTFLSLLFSASSLAQDNTELYKFASPLYQQRFQNLTHQFRCLVCQNQTLADSNAPLAVDMKEQILKMLNQGTTDAQIKAFLVQRYGDFVSYQPPLNRLTFLLWGGPVGLLMLGVFLFFKQFNPLRQR